ncbi:unnamed protein product [Brassicogethes aeneus]|uniref:Phospholipid scramblase n=1 Tax=Brassicogethes aeneus TaxID=1431903 RepID=A0A9P0AYI2_BRAAE|nr:unnamed protein product [Brassicogethes aeneus]
MDKPQVNDENAPKSNRESYPPSYASVVTNQPTPGFEPTVYTHLTSPMAGIDILRNLDYLSIERSASIRQAFQDNFMMERYKILDNQSQVLYKVQRKLKLEFICRQYTFQCLDQYENDVLHLERNIYVRGVFLVDQDIKVIIPPNIHLGTIEWARMGIFSPQFSVKDAQGNLLFLIIGQLDCSCCARIVFTIQENEAPIGKIQYKNMYETECQFPVHLTTVQKALLCGATMLIKDVIYERK